MIMDRLKLFLLSAFILFLASCEVKIPENVIAPDKMEQLLYDYHLVQSMTSEYSSAEYKEKLFYDYVFAKHGVTQGQFEESMGWYNRYPKHLQKIYLALETRLEAEVEELNALGSSPELTVALDFERLHYNTTELWIGPHNRMLSANHLHSHMTFNLDMPEDSSLLVGDSLSFSFDALFVNEARDSIRQKAHAAVLVKYVNGLSNGYSVDVDSSGYFSVAVQRNNVSAINSLSGFVYYSDDDPRCKAKMLLSGISLKRFKAKEAVDAGEQEE